MLEMRKIFLSPSVSPEQQADLRNAIRHLDAGCGYAKVVTRQESATHVVVANSQPSDTDGIRAVEKRGKECLIHWYRHPDSYNTWVDAADVQGAPISFPARADPCVVVRHIQHDVSCLLPLSLLFHFLPPPAMSMARRFCTLQ